ncbi:E3 ubiquitin-protein ligase RNF128-like isoform X2 [Macrobrachium rosenbergii]|uniref:E3 ubiquitin-protein ligase RNF128-like isoform X2 n=1 Tax=Macrobrachium rosenbergii TaxID=79674 RepID=UPI0034D5EF83
MLLRGSLICACVSVCFTFGISAEWSYEGATITLAHLNISYVDPVTGARLTDVREVGKFGSGAVGSASGLVVVGRSRDTTTGGASGSSSDRRDGCTLPWASPSPTISASSAPSAATPSEPWVALVSRGDCPDRDKVGNALALNASGVLIYAKDAQAHLQKIALSSFSRRIYSSALQRLQRYPVDVATDQGHPESAHMIGGERIVVVFLAHEQGEQLARMVENGTKVYVSITRGQDVKYRVTNINRGIKNKKNVPPSSFVALNPICDRGQVFVDCVIVTSVLFVSVSFIILMMISLAWLIFYYIQRFRYIHAKDRLARHLCNAAKKALSKIPVRNLKSGDKEVTGDNECCAICIEPYQVSDTIRILPCRHQFHKYCVDPWLLEHRTCPMCKMDILKFYGYVLSDSEESVLQLDVAEDTSGADIEAQDPLPPPPSSANARGSGVSQVMVVPRPEPAGTDMSCGDGWSESPVPDTPISPVHQPTSATVSSSVPSSAAACSVLRSVIDSAKTRVSHSGRVSHSSQTTPLSSAKSQQSASRATVSSLPEIDVCLGEQCPADTCVQIPERHDNMEISSVCSEDYGDSRSVEDAMGLPFLASAVPGGEHGSSATCRSVLIPCEESTVTPQQPPSVPPSADTRVSSAESSSSSSCKEDALQHQQQRSSSSGRSRSLSRKRSSGFRTRSASKRRSASHARSSSSRGGRSTTRQNSSSHSGASARNSRGYSRPSSHVISVSHV